jgi:hypothetical protein
MGLPPINKSIKFSPRKSGVSKAGQTIDLNYRASLNIDTKIYGSSDQPGEDGAYSPYFTETNSPLPKAREETFSGLAATEGYSSPVRNSWVLGNGA